MPPLIDSASTSTAPSAIGARSDAAGAASDRFEPQRSRFDFWGRYILNLPKSTWAIWDAAAVCLGNYIGYLIFQLQFPRSTWAADLTLVNAVVALAYVTSGVICGLYDTRTLRHRSRIMVRTLLTIGLAVALAYVVMQMLIYEIFSRRIALIGMVTFVAFSGGARLLAHRVIQRVKTRTLFVGCGNSIQRVVAAIREAEAGSIYDLVGCVMIDEPNPTHPQTALPCLGGIENIQPIVRANRIDEIVIAAEETLHPRLSRMIMCCLRQGCRITTQPNFYERVLGEVPVDYITPDWFFQADLDGQPSFSGRRGARNLTPEKRAAGTTGTGQKIGG